MIPRVLLAKSALPLALLLCLTIAACATATPGERNSLLSQPVSCDTTDDHVDALELARPSAGERTRAILQTITPVGLVIGLLSGQIENRAKVAAGNTTREIDEMIKSIEQRCLNSESLGSG